MNYIYLVNNIVYEIIPEEHPDFPGIPITERYSEDFLNKCIAVEEDVEVKQGWQYVEGSFVEPIYSNSPIIIPPDSMEEYLNNVKETKIIQSKEMLASYLEANPLLWTDGQYYSITAEKQAQLTSKLMAASAAQTMSTDYHLTWNSTGEVCKEWTLEDLYALAFAIDSRVTALVTYQQIKEVEIRNAKTIEDVKAITIDYDSVM